MVAMYRQKKKRPIKGAWYLQEMATPEVVNVDLRDDKQELSLVEQGVVQAVRANSAKSLW
jgi:hypothetical protein